MPAFVDVSPEDMSSQTESAEGFHYPDEVSFMHVTDIFITQISIKVKLNKIHLHNRDIYSMIRLNRQMDLVLTRRLEMMLILKLKVTLLNPYSFTSISVSFPVI